MHILHFIFTKSQISPSETKFKTSCITLKVICVINLINWINMHIPMHKETCTRLRSQVFAVFSCGYVCVCLCNSWWNKAVDKILMRMLEFLTQLFRYWNKFSFFSTEYYLSWVRICSMAEFPFITLKI